MTQRNIAILLPVARMYSTNTLVTCLMRSQTLQVRRASISTLRCVTALPIHVINRVAGNYRASSDIQTQNPVHSISGEWSKTLPWAKVLKRCLKEEGPEDVSNMLTHLADKRALITSPSKLMRLCAFLARYEWYNPVHNILNDSLEKFVPIRDKTNASEQFVASGLDKVFDSVLSVYKEKNEWKQVHRMIHLLHDRSIDPSLRILRVFLITCARSNRKEHVHKIIQHLHLNRLVSSLNDVENMKTVTACCQALLLLGQSNRVIQLLGHLVDDLPSSKHYTESRESDLFWIGFKKLIHSGNTIRLNVLVEAYINENQKSQVLRTLSWMHRNKHAKPDCVTFEMILQYLVRHKDYNKALTIYQHAHQLECVSGDKNTLINLASLTAALTAWKSLDQRRKPESAYCQYASDIWNQLDKYDFAKAKEHQILHLFDCLWKYGDRKAASNVFVRVISSTCGVIWSRRNWVRQLSSGAVQVDLHGFSCGAAQSAILFVLHELDQECPMMEELKTTKIGKNWQPDIRIITGVGRHSTKKYMHGELRTRIITLLNEFSPLLNPSQCSTNSGVLLITGHNLRKWMEKR